MNCLRPYIGHHTEVELIKEIENRSVLYIRLWISQTDVYYTVFVSKAYYIFMK